MDVDHLVEPEPILFTPNEVEKEENNNIEIKLESGNGDAIESKPTTTGDDFGFITSDFLIGATSNLGLEDLEDKNNVPIIPPSPIVPTTPEILSSTVIQHQQDERNEKEEEEKFVGDVVEGLPPKIPGEKMSAEKLREVDVGVGITNKLRWEPQIMQTSHTGCSGNMGDHICFDCFPIPDELLIQIHRQTGMSKLMCLQTVQTVIKFYQHDLPCSKFFMPDLSMTGTGPSTKPKATANTNRQSDTSEYSGESDSFNDSIFLFKNQSPIPKQKESASTNSKMDEAMAKLIDDMDEVKISKVKREPKVVLSNADQFRSLISRLKSGTSEFWSDSQNASYVFTFFRKLNKLVVKLDRSILKKLLLEDDMEGVWILTRFLRHERRWSIKWEILGVLGTIAARDSRARRKMLESDFSVYLSRAVLDFNSEPARLAAYAELLTVLFTGGKPIPISHLEYFDVDFVVAVLNMIEDDDSRPGWALPETFVKLLLAFNLQFSSDDVYDNLTIVGIARVGECKTLTSCLIDWMETKDCPLTASWDVTVSVHQCVIKLTTDIFSCRTTSHVFSPSQSVILSRLLIKTLPNFLPGDKRRTSYLKLIQAILRHCKLHYVRNTPSLENLEDILLETSSLSVRDQDVIRSIFKQFPTLRSETDIF